MNVNEKMVNKNPLIILKNYDKINNKEVIL